MLGNKERGAWAKLGAISGLGLPVLLGLLAKYIGSITIQFSTYQVQGVGGLEGILTNYLSQIVQGTLPFQAYIFSAIAGAIFFVLGAMSADYIGALKGTKTERVWVVIFFGYIISFFVAQWALSIPPFDLFVTWAISAVVNALLIVGIASATKQAKFIP